MKTNKFIFIAFIAIVFANLSFTGCKKDDANPSPSPVTAVQDTEVNNQFIATSSFMDPVSMVNSEIARTASTSNISELPPSNFPENILEPLQVSGAKVTVDMNAMPHVAVIDFGNRSTDLAGNIRSGKIIILWQQSVYEAGSKYQVKFDNYFFNENLIEGDVHVENLGRNMNGNLLFNVDTKGSLTILYPRDSDNGNNVLARMPGKKMTYTSFNTVEWITTTSSGRNVSNEVYLMNGRSEGTTLDGRMYSTEIKTPLKKLKAFPYYVRGTLRLNVNNGATTYEVDYGYSNDQLDDLALVTIGSDMQIIIKLNRNPFMIANIQ
jgi:hypothetical protein